MNIHLDIHFAILNGYQNMTSKFIYEPIIKIMGEGMEYNNTNLIAHFGNYLSVFIKTNKNSF